MIGVLEEGGITEGMAEIAELADAWKVGNRVNLMLLDAMTEEQWALAPTSRGRSIADQFAHLHNVRVQWLELQKGGTKLRKIEKGSATKAEVRKALEESGEALAGLFGEGKMKAFPRGVIVFFGYLVAHEGHHRGQILVHLKNGGMAVDKSVAFGIWAWGKI